MTALQRLRRHRAIASALTSVLLLFTVGVQSGAICADGHAHGDRPAAHVAAAGHHAPHDARRDRQRGAPQGTRHHTTAVRQQPSGSPPEVGRGGATTPAPTAPHMPLCCWALATCSPPALAAADEVAPGQRVPPRVVPPGVAVAPRPLAFAPETPPPRV